MNTSNLAEEVHSCGLVEDIVAEIAAKRIIEKRHVMWRKEYEDAHSNGEIAKAALAYVIGATHQTVEVSSTVSILHKIFPWPSEFFRPKRNYRENLLYAASLLVAEIERVDRMTYQSQEEKSDLPVILTKPKEPTETEIRLNAAIQEDRNSGKKTPTLHREVAKTVGPIESKIIRLQRWGERSFYRSLNGLAEFRAVWLL